MVPASTRWPSTSMSCIAMRTTPAAGRHRPALRATPGPCTRAAERPQVSERDRPMRRLPRRPGPAIGMVTQGPQRVRQGGRRCIMAGQKKDKQLIRIWASDSGCPVAGWSRRSKRGLTVRPGSDRPAGLHNLSGELMEGPAGRAGTCRAGVGSHRGARTGRRAQSTT